MIGALGAVVFVAVVLLGANGDLDTATQLTFVFMLLVAWAMFGFDVFGAVDELGRFIGGYL
jgi:hypothetical protein